MRAGWPSHDCLYCLSGCILAVGSQKCPNEHMSAYCAYCGASCSRPRIPGSPFPALHLCPVVPMGGNGVGLTERTEHINFSCIAESLFPHNPAPLPASIPHPQPCLVPGGWARMLATQSQPVLRGMPGRKYCGASGTAGAITPYH